MLTTPMLPPQDAHGFPPPRARQRRVRRVVVGIGVDSASATALVRADHFARALDAALTIVHVVPSRRRFEPLTRETPLEIAMATPLVRACIGPVRRWIESLLGREIQPGALVLGHGPVLPTLLDAVHDLTADLVVLGPGRLARRLLCSERRPVLIARPSTGTARIVASTDFSDPTFPVLRRAVDLGRRLHAYVTFVTSACSAERAVCREDAGEPLVSALTTRFGLPVEVVCSERAPSDAALTAARDRRADLLVVGSRGPTADQGCAEDAGQQIAGSASCSVLVLPLRGAHRSG
ncbi:MAG: universal stress protein [Polyangiaceae bacterium]